MAPAGSNPKVNLGYPARVRAWLFGYDVFISYKRAEALGYALALERALSDEDVACFRDISELPAGGEFEEAILRALGQSGALVVIGTPAALDPEEGEWVRKEVTDYREKRPGSPIIVINIDDVIKSELWPEVSAGTWLHESKSALDPPEPSADVVHGILDGLKFFRVNRLLRWGAGVAALAVAMLVIGILLRG